MNQALNRVGAFTGMGLALAAPNLLPRDAAQAEAYADRADTATLHAHASAKLPKLIFDDLGGGSPIIKVYPGVSNAPADKEFNGTFNDGDIVTAKCKVSGRKVNSDPSVGETDRSSKQWIKIKGTPGETQYATAVYIEKPKKLLKRLGKCSIR